MKRMLLIVLALMVVSWAGCATESGDSSCTVDADCTGLNVCVNGKCSTIQCENAGSCEVTQICLEATGTCAPAECGCLDCPDCPAGLDCVDGVCTGCTGVGCPCTADLECGADHFCDSGVCALCAPDQCEDPPGCTEGSCSEGQKCDTVSGECVDDTLAGACQSCTADSDCGGGGWSCLPVSGNQVCLAPCGSGDDCATGWTCWGGACTPGSHKCLGCAISGCPEGQVCDTNSGSCIQPTGECTQCTYDWECGPGAACHGVGAGVRVCVPRCTGDTPCTGSSACVVDEDSQYKVCAPTGGTCCFDPDPNNCPDTPVECNPLCGGGTPHCKLGLCVECLSDANCDPGETCNTNTWVCGGGNNQCSGATPQWSEAKGACVQCLSDNHCGGDTCNLQTNTCDNDLCSNCVAPYPACTEVNGEFYCVQCTDDTHCGANGVCNLDTYSCEGGTVTPTDPCTGDAECDAGVSGFDLYCGDDELCHDKEGGCDDVTAFCLNGNECTDLLSLLGGGGLPGGLPGGGGQTLPGVCECTPDGSPVDGFPIPLPGLSGSKDCPAGVICGNLFDLLAGGQGGEKNVCGGGLGF